MIINTELLFPYIYDNSDFIKEHPIYHPDSTAYDEYWMSELERLILGYWGTEKTPEGLKYRYMTPQLYYFANYHTILIQEGKQRKKSRPNLLDINWTIMNCWFICRGFSGFSEDTKYTCNWAVKLKLDRLNNPDLPDLDLKYLNCITDNCYTKEGVFKEYIDPLEYLNKTHDSILGEPLYENNSLNMSILGSRSGGKMLKINELVRVKNGWKPIIDLSIGEEVYGSDGKLCKVINKSIPEVSEFYKITLRDGRTIEACKDHQWKVWGKNKNKNNKDKSSKQSYSVINTKDIYDKYYLNRLNSKRNIEGQPLKVKEYNKALPTALPINESKINTNKYLPPYFIGLLLGDGCLTSKNIMLESMDEEILSYAEQVCKSYKWKYSILLHTEKKSKTLKISYNNTNTLNNYLKELGLLGTNSKTKFIPDIYKYSSYEDKMELIRGLMDTDGFSDKSHIEYTTVSDKLSNDFLEVVRSCGINCRHTTKETYYKNKEGVKIDCSLANRITLYTNKKIFNLERKQHFVNNRKGNRIAARYDKTFIVNVEKVNDQLGVCIAVDSYDNTYITKDYIVTHNSFLASAIMEHEFSTDGAKTVEEFLKGDNKVEIFCGSASSSKSGQLLNKFESSLANLPGTYVDSSLYYPSPFSRSCSGTLKCGNSKNAYRYEYEKKIGKTTKKEGTGSLLVHETFQTNKQASVGGRYNVMIIEEVGLEDQLLTVLGASESTMDMGSGKFGSCLIIGCVCEGTKVLNKEGIYVKVEDLKKEDGVLGFNEKTNRFEQVDINFKTGTALKGCYRIETNKGRILEASEDHPIFTRKRNSKNVLDSIPSYVRIDELKLKDRIAVVNEDDKFYSKTIFDPRLIGMLIGDGSFTETTKFVTKDDSLFNYINNKYTVRVDTCVNNLRKCRILGLKGEMIKLRLHLKNKLSKHIPEELFYCDKKTISEFIAGLIDTDGCVYHKDKRVRIKYTSICKHIILDLQLLLSKFGIQSRIKEDKIKLTKLVKNATNIPYTLWIDDSNSLMNFYKNINLLVEYKEEKKNLIPLYHSIKKRNSKLSAYKYLDWEYIKKIEPIGRKPVFNMSVKGSHNYIANGILTHNTGGDMDKVIETEIVFRDPEAYEFLAFKDVYEQRGVISFFLPAIYTNLEYKDKNGNTLIEKSLQYEQQQRELKKKANNSSAYDEYVMSRPLVPSEIFLSKTGNKFPVMMLREQQGSNDRYQYKKHLRTTGFLVEDKDYITGVKFVVDTESKPIDRFPHDSKSNLEAPWEIYEHPPAGFIEPNLYKVVYDPIRDEGGGTSLAAIYVYKSENTIEANGNELVAWWVGRYDQPDDIHRTCIAGAKYYNAQVMFENNIIDFKNFCLRTSNFHLLAPTPKEIIQKVIKDPTLKYEIGIPMTVQLKQYALRLAQQWLLTEKKRYEEELPDGTKREIIIRNLHTIKDDLLLEELIQYNDKGNFDRVSTFLLLMLWIEQDREVVVKKDEKIATSTPENFYTDLYNNRLKQKQLINY